MSTSDTPNAPKALIPVGKPAKPAKLSMGQLAAQVDPAELDADIIEKREALSALADDPTMPETTRNAIRALAALGRSPDDVRTARELCEARRRVASTDAAIDAVRQFVRT